MELLISFLYTPSYKVCSCEVVTISWTLDLKGHRCLSDWEGCLLCRGKKMLWKALQFRGTTWKMGSDSMSTYSNKCIKISLKPCQSTYRLSLWPSICLPIHFSAQVGCLFSTSHQRCIEIQSLALNHWVWGELPEQIRVGGSWRELSSDHSSFSGSVCFPRTLAKLVITVTQPSSLWLPWSQRHTCRSATNKQLVQWCTNSNELMRKTVSFAISMWNLVELKQTTNTIKSVKC